MRHGIVLVALMLPLAAGCGPSQAKLNEAKSQVQEGLETWKKGGKAADLNSKSPAVEFHEAMWTDGETLVSYEPGKVTYDDRNKAIRCEFRLTVRNRRGKERTENVAYDVTPGPPVKIMNNPMP